MIKIIATCGLLMGISYSIFNPWWQTESPKLSESPNFKVGDCRVLESDVNKQRESWEKHKHVIQEKILIVGIKKYLVATDYGVTEAYVSDVPIAYDNLMVKTECSKLLKNFKLKN